MLSAELREAIEHDPNEPEPTLHDDLLETSDRVFHREVAKFQLQQHARFMEFMRQLDAWHKQEQQNIMNNPLQLAWMVKEHIKKIRAQLRAETKEAISGLLRMKHERNEGIEHYTEDNA